MLVVKFKRYPWQRDWSKDKPVDILGTKFPDDRDAPSKDEMMSNIEQVHASGPELEHLMSQFTSIPMPVNPDLVHDVIIWTGDMAKFIAMNLKP